MICKVPSNPNYSSFYDIHGRIWEEIFALQNPVSWTGQRRLADCFCGMETFLPLCKKVLQQCHACYIGPF